MFEVTKKFAQMQKDIDSATNKILTEKISQYVGRELSQSQIVEMIKSGELKITKCIFSYLNEYFLITGMNNKTPLAFTTKVESSDNEQGYVIIVEEVL